MPTDFSIDPYDPCPCGSGKKYKFCCAAKAKDLRHGKFPIGTVAWYGPDADTTNKIAAAVFFRERGEPVVQRWHGPTVTTDPKLAAEIKQFFASRGVKTVVATNRNIGCPHEEGIDFPAGRECPMCPFWAGKQGIVLRDKDDAEEYEDDYADNDLEAEGDSDDPAGDDEIESSNLEMGYQGDFDALMERMEALVGACDDRGESINRLCAHLQANLTLPCQVTGIEDFTWEERYVIGGWDPKEYQRLKKICPSYRDRYQLLSINVGERSEWMMFGSEDIAAHVRRIKDGKEFVLGLAEIKAVDRESSNHKHIEEYAVWFVNSR